MDTDTNSVFNPQPSHYRKDGSAHYPGQIYSIKRYRKRLWDMGEGCGICLKPIRKLENATLDHIVPRVHGGHTTKDNVQLAHRWCNFKKGHEIL